jgi:pSer/pThr/pTyr-binding forkhead associated (FHA) protein
MYKLVVVGGKLRGQEYTLKSGDNVLGRDSSCDIHFQIEGVSKKHLTITITDDVLYLLDMGSANGTFLNSRIVKRAAIKAGDKIGLPNAILQLVYVQEKKVVVKKKVSAQKEREQTLEEVLSGGKPPEGLVQKLFWLFRYKIMRPFHGLNQEYEWRYMLGIATALFAICTITLTISPVLQDSKEILMKEVEHRGEHYAKEIARINAVAIEQGHIDQIDTKFLDDEEEQVVSYELFDLNGRIVRPISRLNEITNDPFSVSAKEELTKGRGKGANIYRKALEDNQIGICRVITALNSKTGNIEPVGYISIRFAPTSLVTEASQSATAYFESLITSLLVGVFFFGVIYYLTLRPFEELKFQIEEALRGKRRALDSLLLFEELDPVRNAVNTSLQRLRELQRDENDVDPNDIESDDNYINTLKEFILGAAGPAIILNSAKNLVQINNQAEDVCGIRQSMAEGMNILDVTKERGFAATLIEMCDNSANNMGTSQQGHYELQGKQYNIYINSLMGKDGFAKAFYISFVIDN